MRMLFYAGHGVQVRAATTWCRSTPTRRRKRRSSSKGADVGEFVDRLSAIPTGINIVVLDACRVNPFAAGVIVGPDGRRLKFRGATPGGLATLDAPVGTLVAFSTAPNGVALDGASGKHSVYAVTCWPTCRRPGCRSSSSSSGCASAWPRTPAESRCPGSRASLTSDFCFKSDDKGRCG